jgi:integrase/recombinase XerD
MGYDGKSNRSRQLGIEEFLGWMEGRGIVEIGRIDTVALREYNGYLRERENRVQGGRLSGKTVYGLMRGVGDFMEMLCRQGDLAVNPCSGLRLEYPREERERRILTRQEMEWLYEAAESSTERAILALGYGCGLRAREAERCNTEDVRWGQGVLVVRHGKGEKRRVVPMSEGVIRDLGTYCRTDREDESRESGREEKALLLNRRGRRMREETLNRHLREMVERSGRESLREGNISLHCLRHTIATHLLERGMEVEQVRLFLGHSQIETTRLYTHISESRLEELTR